MHRNLGACTGHITNTEVKLPTGLPRGSSRRCPVGCRCAATKMTKPSSGGARTERRHSGGFHRWDIKDHHVTRIPPASSKVLAKIYSTKTKSPRRMRRNRYVGIGFLRSGKREWWKEAGTSYQQMNECKITERARNFSKRMASVR